MFQVISAARRALTTFDPRLQSVSRRGLLLGMAAVAAVGAAVPIRAGAEVPALPPCDGTSPQPPYAAIGAAPNVQMWKDQSLPEFLGRAECLGWAGPAFRILIAVAGTLQTADGADALLSRFGEISSLVLVKYWSTTDQTWRPLVLAAAALTQKVTGRARGDFTTEELKSGQNLYLSQRDSRGASEVVYRMRVRENTRDRLVIETENVTSIRMWAVTLFKAGDLRSLYTSSSTPQAFGHTTG